jgi:hypothetical protein
MTAGFLETEKPGLWAGLFLVGADDAKRDCPGG